MNSAVKIAAAVLIVGGIAAILWYSSLSKEEQERLDKLAKEKFNKLFNQLADGEQTIIKEMFG